ASVPPSEISAPARSSALWHALDAMRSIAASHSTRSPEDLSVRVLIVQHLLKANADARRRGVHGPYYRMSSRVSKSPPFRTTDPCRSSAPTLHRQTTRG